MEHLFFTCTQAHQRWVQLQNHAATSRVCISISPSLLHTIILIVRRHQRDPLPMLFISEILHSIWLDRWFHHHNYYTPLYTIIHQTHAICESLFHFASSPRILPRLNYRLIKLDDMLTSLIQPIPLPVTPPTHHNTLSI